MKPRQPDRLAERASETPMRLIELQRFDEARLSSAPRWCGSGQPDAAFVHYEHTLAALSAKPRLLCVSMWPRSRASAAS
jgi:hypothetical protein